LFTNLSKNFKIFFIIEKFFFIIIIIYENYLFFYDDYYDINNYLIIKINYSIVNGIFFFFATNIWPLYIHIYIYIYIYNMNVFFKKKMFQTCICKVVTNFVWIQNICSNANGLQRD